MLCLWPQRVHSVLYLIKTKEKISKPKPKRIKFPPSSWLHFGFIGIEVLASLIIAVLLFIYPESEILKSTKEFIHGALLMTGVFVISFALCLESISLLDQKTKRYTKR